MLHLLDLVLVFILMDMAAEEQMQMVLVTHRHLLTHQQDHQQDHLQDHLQHHLQIHLQHHLQVKQYIHALTTNGMRDMETVTLQETAEFHTTMVLRVALK